MSSVVFAQQTESNEQKEQLKAHLFDEFGKISQKEIKLRSEKLRKKLQERDSINENSGAYLIFYTDSKEKSSRQKEILIRDVLFDNCRDCYGFSEARIVFVNGGEKEKQKVQFWLVPAGAEPPIPE